MTAILIIGGVLIMVLLSSSDRYSTRYDSYNRTFPPPHPYYSAPMTPHYDPSQEYYRYRAEKSRESLGYTALFLVLLFLALFYFGGNTDNKASEQDTYKSVRQQPHYR